MIKFLISLILSGFFLYLVIRGLDFKALAEALLGVHFALLIPGMLIHLSSFWIRGMRWRNILAPLKTMTTRDVFPAMAISYLANNTLPMRAGEVIRAFVIGRDQGLSKMAAISSIALERVFDGLTLLCLLGVVALLAPLPDWARSIAVLAGLGFLAVAAVMVGLVVFRRSTLALLGRLLAFLPERLRGKLEQVLERFVSGLDAVQNPRILLSLFGWSLVIWGIEVLALQVTAAACGIDLSLMGAIFTLVIINLGTMIPSSPGYIGTFEFFCVKSLAAFHIAAAPAMGFALVLHVVQFLPITLVGLVFFLRQQNSLRGVMQQKAVSG